MGQPRNTGISAPPAPDMEQLWVSPETLVLGLLQPLIWNSQLWVSPEILVFRQLEPLIWN